MTSARQRRPHRRFRRPAAPPAPRRGSTLLIVIALLALLSLIGVVFYTFASQERSNAEYFSEGAKDLTVPGNSADIYFDWALEQLIVGPDDSLVQSALWGKRHALLTNMLGRDAAPFNGTGIRVIDDGNGNLAIDMDRDGDPDSDLSPVNDPAPENHLYFRLNHSPAANPDVYGGAGLPVLNTSLYPDPDVDYTAPDINNPFLAYVGQAIQTNGIPRLVVIPSFMRPQYLRDSSGANPAPIYDWYTSPLTASKSFRPHPEHVVVGSGGIRRFVHPSEDTVALGLSHGAFPFTPADVNTNGAFGELGVWTHWGNPAHDGIYELDVSNDGDAAGIKEGIWMDLDFPVQTLPNGAKYVPLFSFTVYDADALLNLNVHGNMPHADQIIIDGTPFSPSEFLAKSAQGLDPSEVNLQWGLHLDPTTLSTAERRQYELFFGRDLSTVTRKEFSNMEYWFLNKGRPEFNTLGSGPAIQSEVTDLYPGRNGEENRLYNALRMTSGANMLGANFPFPGFSEDDDQNEQPETPPFIHPLAYNGLGTFWRTDVHYGATNPKRVDLVSPLGSNPSAWLRYDGYQRFGQFGWNQFLPNSLVTNLTTGAHIDDESERVVALDANIPNLSQLLEHDKIFGADGMAWMHLSDADITNTALTHRLGRLLPASFSQQNEHIRKLFTTLSWDRKQFALPHWGVRDSTAMDDTVLAHAPRPWEFNHNGGTEFPPSFGNTAGTNQDPFRPPVREFLRIAYGDRNSQNRQMKLQWNRLLVGTGQTLQFRELRDHPSSITQADIDNNLPGGPWEQERQARRDRQLLCRDIYVMLYTLGGGRAGVDYTRNNDFKDELTPGDDSDYLYSPEQLRMMAQFAVNVVDALDRDNVITMFEYDKNLGNGWNLDDDPTTDDGFARYAEGEPGHTYFYPMDSDERGVVYGVEAQSLTFSEGLYIHSKRDESANHTSTLFNDMDKDRYYLYAELRNAAPRDVPLALPGSDAARNGIWRIRRDGGIAGKIDPDDNVLTFLFGVSDVTAGGQFVIGTSDGSHMLEGKHVPSDFRVDHDLDGDFNLIAPFVSDPSPPTEMSTYSEYPGPYCHLDLVHERDETRFVLQNNPMQKGSFLMPQDLTQEIDPSLPITLVLERRAHPGATLGTNSNEIDPKVGLNPWIEVDRIEIGPAVQFDPATGGTNPTLIQQELQKLKSRERPQPFARINEQNFNDSVDSIHYNSLRQPRNSNSPSEFTYWQPHFDRDFASPVELFNVPLYDPRDVTTVLPESRFTPRAQALAPRIAAAKFLVPQLNAGSPDPVRDNFWYRIFEFFEVSHRDDPRLGNPISRSRTPGKLNLNTLRHPEALGALLDDENIVELDVNDSTDSNWLPDQLESGRDWWEQFLKARDPMDPVTNLHLPGTAVSRPFRSFSYLGEGHDSLESTLFRKLPLDANSANPDRNRLLFEIGDASEHVNGDVDPVLRYRLLSKIFNNTTTRSNVFIVFVTVGFFEAAEVEVGGNRYVRIGNKLPDPALPEPPYGHRGFFIVDRSEVEKANDSITREFNNWRALVKYRLTIR